MATTGDPTVMTRDAAIHCEAAYEAVIDGDFATAAGLYRQAERSLKRADELRGIDDGPVSLDARRDVMRVLTAGKRGAR